MDTLMQILAALAGLFVMWYLYTSIKNNPQSFSKQNLSKSAYTMGLLALALIAFVGVCVMLLRAG